MIIPLLLMLAGWARGASPSPADSSQPLLVTPAWLAGHLHDKGLIIFHVGDRASRPVYDAGHIPGAQFLAPLSEFSTPHVDGALMLELPRAEVLDSVLESKGVSNDSRIVLCPARQYLSPTSRALLTLEYVGMAGRVSVLDGGLEAWQAEGRPVSTEVPVAAKGSFTPHLHPELIADAGYVRTHLADPDTRIVDARDTSFYNGRETHQGRNGHIRGAISIPFSTMADSSGRTLPLTELRARFRQAGVKEGQWVVTYCHIGQQATFVWFGARLLGIPARLYDGSFQDWAAHPELPVDNPAEKRP
jgi:thiosulfate/3-mercaptopyruvate sulfurtransferase